MGLFFKKKEAKSEPPTKKLRTVKKTFYVTGTDYPQDKDLTGQEAIDKCARAVMPKEGHKPYYGWTLKEMREYGIGNVGYYEGVNFDAFVTETKWEEGTGYKVYMMDADNKPHGIGWIREKDINEYLAAADKANCVSLFIAGGKVKTSEGETYEEDYFPTIELAWSELS